MYQQDALANMVSIIRKGLPKTNTPKKIIIIGAGLAGLVSATLLKEAGHHVIVLEASSRVGGRVFTMREPFSEGLHFEAGAKRIPTTHYLMWEYINKFKLKFNEFINSTPDDWLYVNGLKARRWYYEENPDYFGYPVAPHERGKTASELLRSVAEPLFPSFGRYTDRNIPTQVAQHLDQYSLDSFLRRNPFGEPLSPGAIEKVNVMMGVQGFSEYNAIDVIRAFMPVIMPDVSFYELTDGNDQLPKKLYQQLKEELYFNERVRSICSDVNEVKVTVENTKTGQYSEVRGDTAVVAIPFSALQLVDLEPFDAFSKEKRRAIRDLRYMPATKVGVEFKSRFWEKDGLFGGHMLTDLPSRFTYYPSRDIGKPGPAIVVGTYTLGDDTLPWDSQTEGDKLKFLLHYLAKVHGDVVFDELATAASYVWRQDPFICGDISVLKPEDGTQIAPFIATREGRVHFTGEHTSSHPAWMEGGIESGIRVALEVNNR
ncbi:amine oxidase [Anaerobacillus arseniciselenatis]|uniref:Amine oxidase n=1 Tax=Anaerobacillus arseniciselenatis TaxID=85682 RepID=A0A1S2LKS7_9BACI|nr:flavin monoamine oxidase family protein [Anaerobacillus arseniciselenatis]OIJ12297.1 amine oxidase [Anaerobacillus arseniciselenatis]